VTDSDDSLHIYVHKLDGDKYSHIRTTKFQQEKKINALKIRVAMGSNIIKHDNTSVSRKLKIEKNGWETEGDQPLSRW
jgi:hypothetical protein